MFNSRRSRNFALALGALLCGAPQAQLAIAQEPAWVAGLTPDRRPEAAPTVAESKPDAAFKRQRLAGVTTPWPGNLERIAEQGAWYSPMFARGMPGRYDLRGLHPEAGR